MRREREDAKALGLAALLVPSTWLLLLGWSWERSVAGHDGLAQSLPLLQRLTRAGGDWSRLLYLPDWLGGSYVRDVVGPFPPFAAFARLGFSPAETLNLTVFLWQVLLAFLGARLASDLAGLWGGGGQFWKARFAAVWLCGFAPMLGWLFGYGHLVLIVGAAPLTAELALIAATAAGSMSVVLTIVTAFVFWAASLYSAQQTAFYAAFFGAPVLLGLWLSTGNGLRRLTLPILIPVASMLVALPSAWGMFARAFGSDAPRLLGSESVTYDFVTSTVTDWVTSIPWTRSSVPANRPEMLHHAVNTPVGPLVVLLALLPWRRCRALVLGLAASLGLVLLFSMNVKPFSSWLLSLVPPLNYFRVPARAVLPLLMVLPAFAMAAVLGAIPSAHPGNGPVGGRPEQRSKRGAQRPVETGGTRWLEPRDALALPLGVAMLLLPTLAREVAGWTLALAAALFLRRRPAGRLSAAAVLVALGVASAGAFRERLLPMQDATALLRDATAVGEAIRTAQPELQSPLTRVQLGSEIPAFSVNTAFAAGLSSVEGYHFPTRRFAALVLALRGAPYEPSAVFFRIEPQDPAFSILRQLYNVQWEAKLDEKRQLVITPLGPTQGPAWFSSRLARVEGFESLASALRSESGGLDRAGSRTLLFVGPDPLVARARLPAEIDPSCAETRVGRVAPAEGSGVTIAVEAPGACPLTIALNFAESLVATASFADGRKEAATVFPAYGALSAVWVPRGAREVRLSPISPQPGWTLACLPLGALGLGFSVLRART